MWLSSSSLWLIYGVEFPNNFVALCLQAKYFSTVCVYKYKFTFAMGIHDAICSQSICINHASANHPKRLFICESLGGQYHDAHLQFPAKSPWVPFPPSPFQSQAHQRETSHQYVFKRPLQNILPLASSHCSRVFLVSTNKDVFGQCRWLAQEWLRGRQGKHG